MARFAPLLIILLALTVCLWSATSARGQDESDDEEASPTPDLFGMPTPVPTPGEEPAEDDLFGMPTPVPTPGEEPAEDDLFGMPTPVPTPGEEPAEDDLFGMPTPVPTPGQEPAATPTPAPTPTPEPAPAPLRRLYKLEGQAALKTAVDTQWDTENEDVWSSNLYAYMAASTNWGSVFSANVGGLVEYRYDVGDRAHGELLPELRELYGMARWGNLDLFVGHQIVSWGVVDGINPLDRLNPLDYRRAIDIELNYTRLPTFMIRPVFYAGDFTLEAALIPVFTPPHYDVVGSDWSLTLGQFPLSDLLNELRTSEDWRELERFVAHWAPDWRDDMRDLLADPDYYETRADIPDQDLTAPEGAVRLKWATSDFDFYLAYLALWDDIPTLHMNPELYDLNDLLSETDTGYAQLIPPDQWPIDPLANPFELTHHRVQSAGLGLSGIVGDFGLRAEGTMDFDRYTYRTDFTAVRRDMATWVLNADYTFPHDVLISGLLIQSYIFDREDDFISRAWRHMAGLVWRTSFFDQRLSFEGLALLDMTYLNGADWRSGDVTSSGWTLDPLLTYEISDALKAGVGANLFGGQDDTLIGYLQGNNRVFALVRYGF